MGGGLSFLLGLFGLGAGAAINKSQASRASHNFQSSMADKYKYMNTNWVRFYEIAHSLYADCVHEYESDIDKMYPYLIKEDEELIKACQRENKKTDEEIIWFIKSNYNRPMHNRYILRTTFADGIGPSWAFNVSYEEYVRMHKYWRDTIERYSSLCEIDLKKPYIDYSMYSYSEIMWRSTQLAQEQTKDEGYWAGDDYFNSGEWAWGVDEAIIRDGFEKLPNKKVFVMNQDRYVRSHDYMAYQERNNTFRTE